MVRWVPEETPRGEGPGRSGGAVVAGTATAALVLVLLVLGAATPASGRTQARPKPTATATSTASPTPTASATPTASPTPRATATPTASPTPTPSPTPTASATPTAGCASDPVEHAGSLWCPVGVLDVVGDLQPDGTPVALLGVVVEDAWDHHVLLVAAEPCPPGYFCGATVVTLVLDVGDRPLPDVSSTIDVYGLTAPAGGLTVLDLVSRP
jgi:hypothetical protein